MQKNNILNLLFRNTSAIFPLEKWFAYSVQVGYNFIKGLYTG